MYDPVDRAVRTIARRNSHALVSAQLGVVHLVQVRLWAPRAVSSEDAVSGWVRSPVAD